MTRLAPSLASRVATLGPVGYLPAAPGTWGSAAALPPALALGLLSPPSLGAAALAVGAALLTLVGVWAAARHPSSDEDPKEVVIDEAAGQWLAALPCPFLAATPGTAALAWLAAFALFRFFDIAKPWPVSAAERLPGAVGVMADDLVAGALAAASLVTLSEALHGVV